MATRPPLSGTDPAIIFTGLAIAIFGAMVAARGLGGMTAFEGSVGRATIQTTHVGWAILVVGALLAGGGAMNLPQNGRVFGDEKPRFTERWAATIAMPSLLGAGRGAITFVILLMVGTESSP
jgi:hypothetical protein